MSPRTACGAVTSGSLGFGPAYGLLQFPQVRELDLAAQASELGTFTCVLGAFTAPVP